MDVGDWLLLLLGIVGITYSLLSLGSVVLHVWRTPREKCSSFIVGYGLVFFFLGFPCWALVAGVLSKMGAPQSLTWLITLVVNGVMQPILAFGVVRGIFQVVLCLMTGQAYYGWKVIPPEGWEPAEYKQLFRYRILQGVAGTAAFAVLSLAFLSPWL